MSAPHPASTPQLPTPAGRTSRGATVRHAHPVECAWYRDGQRHRSALQPDEQLAECRASGGGFVWVALHEPEPATLRSIGQMVGVPAPLLDTVAEAGRSAAVVDQGVIQVTVRTLRRGGDPEPGAVAGATGAGTQGGRGGEIVVIVAPELVLTIRRGEYGVMRALRFRLEREPARLAAGPAAVLHAVVDRVITDCVHAVQAVERQLDSVATALPAGDGGAGPAAHAETMLALERQLLAIHQAATSASAPLATLTRDDHRLVGAALRMRLEAASALGHQLERDLVGLGRLVRAVRQTQLLRAVHGHRQLQDRIAGWGVLLALPLLVVAGYAGYLSAGTTHQGHAGYLAALALATLAGLLARRSLNRERRP